VALVDRVTRNATDPDLSIVGQYDTPLEVPLTRIITTNNVIGYQDMQTIWSPDGAPIAATSPGTWGQLYAAGRT
jgi:hypothetical protein